MITDFVIEGHIPKSNVLAMISFRFQEIADSELVMESQSIEYI